MVGQERKEEARASRPPGKAPAWASLFLLALRVPQSAGKAVEAACLFLALVLHPFPADTAARAGRGTAAVAAVGEGDMRGTSVPAPPPHAASAGETATPQLQNVLTSAAGPPSRRTEPSAVKALLPLWAGLDASMYSFRFNEGAFLRGEIFTFSFPGGHLRPDDTQTGSPPLPFPIRASLEGSGGGAAGGAE